MKLLSGSISDSFNSDLTFVPTIVFNTPYLNEYRVINLTYELEDFDISVHMLDKLEVLRAEFEAEDCKVIFTDIKQFGQRVLLKNPIITFKQKVKPSKKPVKSRSVKIAERTEVEIKTKIDSVVRKLEPMVFVSYLTRP